MENPSKSVSFSGNQNVFKIWVPARFGGLLQVGCKQSGSKIKLTHSGADVKDITGKTPTIDSFVNAEIPPGQFGWFTAAVSANSNVLDMWARFFETGLSREQANENADPLIPWNFWYFPFTDTYPEKTAWGSSTLQPCQKYERAFGKAGVLDWEMAHHRNPNARDWEGHCDDAVFASVYFATPSDEGKPAKEHEVWFTCEELKFLAAEFAGQMKVPDWRWTLPPNHPHVGPFHEKKPSDKADIWDYSELFGKKIGGFHKVLRQALLIEKMPLLMDLRDARGQDHTQVWNHAVYRYVAQYWETMPHGNWKDIQVETLINANADHLNDDFSSGGSPAKIIKGPKPGGIPKSTVPNNDPGIRRRDQTLRYRVMFRDDGDIDEKNALNRWFSVKHTPTTVEHDLHAPRYAAAPGMPTGNPAEDKNPNVQIAPADVLQLLPLRARFKTKHHT